MDSSTRQYEFGPFRLDPLQRRLLLDEQPVPLEPKAFDTLLVLVQNSGRLLDKEELIRRVWPETFVEDNNLTRNISILRKALGEERSGPRYIETVPKRGYRFIAAVRELNGNAAELSAESRASSPVAPRERKLTGPPADAGIESVNIRGPLTSSESATRLARLRKGRSIMALAVALIVLTAALLFFWRRQTAEVQPGRAARVIAVLPFKPISAESRDAYLELGMADALITKLSNLSQLVVRPTSAVRKYTDLEQDPAAAGRELRAEAVLEGSVQRLGDRLRVTARLLRVADGQPLWAGKFDEQYTDLFAVQDVISDHITRELALTLTGPEKQLLAKRYTKDARAYDAYLRGRFFWNKRTEDGYYKAIEHFRQAIAADPNYALAYAGLADTYLLLGDYSYLPPRDSFPKATEAMLMAVKLDDTLAEAHTALAYTRFLYDWNWQAADNEFVKALALNPAYATAHQWHGEYKAAMGRFDEAKAGIKRAQEIDPTSLILNAEEGWIDYIARDYDAAIGHCRKAIELEENFYPAYFWLGQVYEKKHQYREAIAAYEKALALSTRSAEVIASLGHAYAANGERAKAKETLAELQALAQRRYISPYFMALIYEGLGEHEPALKWLQKAYEDRSRSMPFLKVDPMFDSMRGDPRFTELLKRIGLEQ